MKLYRFSPIKDKEQVLKTIKYVAMQTTKLCKKATGKKLPIAYLTIFAHYDNEYRNLIKILNKMGGISNANNGVHISLYKPIRASGHNITHVRIRKPDPYRIHVGCVDFEVKDYENFKDLHVNRHAKNLRTIERLEYEMVELFDPDFDVLGYVVQPVLKIQK